MLVEAWWASVRVGCLGDLQSDHFDVKQFREYVGLPLTCHSFPNLTTFAFRSSEVRRLLIDMDPYGGILTLGMFPLFDMKLLMFCPPS